MIVFAPANFKDKINRLIKVVLMEKISTKNLRNDIPENFSDSFNRYYDIFEDSSITDEINDDDIKDLKEILSRKLFICVNNSNKGGILVLGANPSYDGKSNDNFCFSLNELLEKSTQKKGFGEKRKSPYWTHIRNILGEEYASKANYLDVFPLKKKPLDKFKRLLDRNVLFQKAILMETHKRIVELHPKIIIVRYKRIQHLFGTDSSHPWLGYNIDKERTVACVVKNDLNLDVRVIPEELLKGDHVILKKNELKGTYLIFDENCRPGQLNHDNLKKFIESKQIKL